MRSLLDPWSRASTVYEHTPVESRLVWSNRRCGFSLDLSWNIHSIFTCRPTDKYGTVWPRTAAPALMLSLTSWQLPCVTRTQKCCYGGGNLAKRNQTQQTNSLVTFYQSCFIVGACRNFFKEAKSDTWFPLTLFPFPSLSSRFVSLPSPPLLCSHLFFCPSPRTATRPLTFS